MLPSMGWDSLTLPGSDSPFCGDAFPHTAQAMTPCHRWFPAWSLGPDKACLDSDTPNSAHWMMPSSWLWVGLVTYVWWCNYAIYLIQDCRVILLEYLTLAGYKESSGQVGEPCVKRNCGSSLGVGGGLPPQSARHCSEYCHKDRIVPVTWVIFEVNPSQVRWDHNSSWQLGPILLRPKQRNQLSCACSSDAQKLWDRNLLCSNR